MLSWLDLLKAMLIFILLCSPFIPFIYIVWKESKLNYPD